MYYIIKYRVPLYTGKWARYINREIKLSLFYLIKAVKCLPNKLTLFYSKIHYKEKNYLKIRTVLLKYITLFYSKRFSISVHWYIGILNILYTHIPTFQTYA